MLNVAKATCRPGAGVVHARAAELQNHCYADMGMVKTSLSRNPEVCLAVCLLQGGAKVVHVTVARLSGTLLSCTHYAAMAALAVRSIPDMARFAVSDKTGFLPPEFTV